MTGSNGPRWVACVALLVAGAFLLAGCGRGGYLRGPQEEAAKPTFSPRAVAPGASATPTVSATTGGSDTFGEIVLDLPDRWRLERVDETTACVLPPGQRACLAGAMTLELLPKEPTEPVDWPADTLDRPAGWQRGDSTFCYVPGAPDPGHGLPGDSRIDTATTRRLSDGARAVVREWEVPCSGGASFAVRLWYVPAKRVVFYVMGRYEGYGAAYDTIVDQADLGDHRPS